MTHVWVWHPTTETSNVLSLNQVQVALLQRLYRGSQRVAVELLHGGSSGSLVLKVNSWNMDGGFDEPTIGRLDHTEALESEVQQTIAMLEHIGKSTAAIVKAAENIGQWSGIVFEDQGAC